MRFPLNGKYTVNDVFLERKRTYIKKRIKLPKGIDRAKVLKLISEYKRQLEENGTPTTRLYSKTIEKSTGSIVLIEDFYIKNLEIELGRTPRTKVEKYFVQMLRIVDRNYIFGKFPKTIVEVKPSNFLLDCDKIIYCDLVPPRVIKNRKISGKQLDFTYKNDKSKLKELRFRFISKEGALYYMILHAAAVRPDMLNYFIRASLNNIENKQMKTRIKKLINSESFHTEMVRLEPFYRKRRTAYLKFMRMMAAQGASSQLFH